MSAETDAGELSGAGAALRATGVTAGYGGDPVIRDISVHVEPGQVVSLVGANGSGKSTLLKSLVGVIRMSAGTPLALIALPAAMGKRRIWQLAAASVGPDEAVEYGLANKVVPADEFDAAVAEWATKLASKSPVLMRLGHDAMYRQQDMALDDALEFLRSQLSLTFTTEDIVEGVTAFFEKRDPHWKGR